MSRELRTHNDDTDWEWERILNTIQWKTIQIEDTTSDDYVDYHMVIEQEEQEELNGQYLVDFIIEKASFPNGRW